MTEGPAPRAQAGRGARASNHPHVAIHHELAGGLVEEVHHYAAQDEVAPPGGKANDLDAESCVTCAGAAPPGSDGMTLDSSRRMMRLAGSLMSSGAGWSVGGIVRLRLMSAGLVPGP